MIGIIIFVGFLFCIGFLRMMLREGQRQYKLPEPVDHSTSAAKQEYNVALANYFKAFDNYSSERPTPTDKYHQENDLLS